MSKPQLYYDYPQEAWHDLFVEAEDYLYEEYPGLCVVGAWPSGPLVYGVPTEKPGIFILCTDDVDRMLDPVWRDKLSIRKVINPQITVWSINHWVYTILCVRTALVDSLLPLLLPLQTSIYIDDSINDVLASARDVVRDCAKYISLFNLRRSGYQQELYRALEYRACLVFIYTKLFYPCINSGYDTVKYLADIPELQNIDNRILELDNRIISSAVDMEKVCSNDLLEYVNIVRQLMKQRISENHEQYNDALEKKLRKSVISLYKSYI